MMMKLLHVTDAFREDPVSVLRVARLAARFPDVRVAPEAMSLMRDMVASGEVGALSGDQVWREFASGLCEAAPWKMLDVLLECGALHVVMPELAALVGVPQPVEHHPEVCTFEHIRLVLMQAVAAGADLGSRFACLVHDLGKAATPREVLPRHPGHAAAGAGLVHQVAARWRVPAEVRDLAVVVAAEHTNIHASLALGGKAVMRLFERFDAFHHPRRFQSALLVCEWDARGRLGLGDRDYPQRRRLEAAFDAALGTDTEVIAERLRKHGVPGKDIEAACKGSMIAGVDVALVAFDAQ